MSRTALGTVLGILADPGTWEPLSIPLRDADDDYRAVLDRARERSGSDESVIVGLAQVAGHQVVLIAGDFDFLAGSVGHSAADRVVAGFREATARRLPVVALPTSGGTRMQEGTAAFVRMADIAGAAAEFAASGGLRIAWLRGPTTGGVMATWGSLADVTGAEPGALLGFLGPRVYEALYGRPFPSGVQTSENLQRVGVIDAVVPAEQLRAWVDTLLRGVLDRDPQPAPWPPQQVAAVDSWDCVEVSRRPDRLGPDAVLALLDHATELSGTGAGEAGGGVRLILGRVLGRPAVVIAQNRQEVTPAGLRVARRGLDLAERLRLPVVTLVDTPGGELSAEAEESAMAGEIARTLAALRSLTVPSVSCVMGQGCGGAALALVPARKVICSQYGWISPLPPEGASVITHRTPDRADEMARAQGVGSTDLRAAGIVDVVVEERPDTWPADLLAAVAAALDEEGR